MPHLVAALLATPVFGLALEPPAASLALDASFVVFADLDALDEAGFESEGEPESESEAEAETETESETESEEDSYVAQMKRRNSIAELHRPFGIATWVAMTATVGLGFVQYYNKYGFFAGQGENPCVEGTAVLGQGQCTGTPVLHLGAASLTTALYATTFTLSLLMPDPDNLSEGKGEFASTLRLHKLLRWVHFGGMVAQVVLGVVIATDVAGLDRANDYGTLQALATVHMGAGLVTWGALSWAGALMTF